jgi:hypothetical protein
MHVVNASSPLYRFLPGLAKVSFSFAKLAHSDRIVEVSSYLHIIDRFILGRKKERL